MNLLMCNRGDRICTAVKHEYLYNIILYRIMFSRETESATETMFQEFLSSLIPVLLNPVHGV